MLIILYIVTGILIFAGFQPFTIAGIFFGICYLPGLTLFALIKKDSLKIEDIILVFPASIGISSLLTLGLLYIGVHVKFIAFIIYGITGLILLFYVIKYKKSPSLTIKLSAGESRFIIIATLVTLVFSIPVISERIAISAHGFHHFSIVTQIFNGIFPPENPGLGGTAISYHWGYHTLVAALSFPVNLHPLRVFSILNIMSLFFILCIAYRSAKSFGISEAYCYLVPLALIGLMRSDAGIFFVQNVLSGNFPPAQNAAFTPLKFLSNWVWGVSYLDTRLFFMNKFYNANNMPLGICLIFAFFFILLHLQEEKMKNINRKVYLVLLAVVLIALAITYAFFLIIPMLFVPVWSGVLFFLTPGSYKEKFRESLKLIVPCAIAAVIVAPYLFIITSGTSVFTEGKSFSEVKFFYLHVQTIRNLIVFLLPSPLIIAGFWFAFKRFAFSRKLLFLLSGTLICLLLSIFLRLQWYNSAKFSFILSFFFSFLFVFTLQHLLPLLSRCLKRGAVSCIVVFLFATPVITETAYICSPWFRDSTYAFSGRHVLFAQDKSRNDAYLWIRDNTPPEALLMLPYVSTPFWNNTAHTMSYRPAALSERSLFVIKDVYAFISPEFKKRVSIREKLFEDPTNTQVKQYFASLNRPVYLLVEEGYEDPLMEGIVFDQVPEDPGTPFVLVYQNDMQRVYRLEFKK